MTKNSTLFFILDNTDKQNELFTVEDMVHNGKLYREELSRIFANIEYSPRDHVMIRILEKIH